MTRQTLYSAAAALVILCGQVAAQSDASASAKVAAQSDAPASAKVAARSDAPASAKEQLLKFTTDEQIQLATMVDLLCKREGLKVYYSPGSLEERVEIRADTYMPASSLRPFVERLLAANGYAIISDDDGWLRVVRGKELRSAPSRVVSGPLGKSNETVTWVRPLEVLSAQRATEIVKPLLTPEVGYVYPVSEAGALIILDSGTGLRRISKVLALLDKPQTDYEVMRITLDHVSAQRAKSTVESLLSGISGLSGMGKSKSTVVADKNANALIIIAKRSQVDLIMRCVKMADVRP